MDNGHDMLQLCRLCLVKDDVNIPIFQEHDDNSEIFVKISSCLPVKLERNDKLPQNICDSCFSKLDVVYDLWTTSSNSDKQLHKWLYEAEAANAKEKRLTKASNKSGDAIVKQEKIDDAHETVTYVEEVPWDGASSSAGPSASLTAEDEPPPKRARRAAAVKASITVAAESDDDDDDDNGPMTKMEDDSDEDDPTFGDVPSTSADDQPGPSGVGKDGSEAPSKNNTYMSVNSKWPKKEKVSSLKTKTDTKSFLKLGKIEPKQCSLVLERIKLPKCKTIFACGICDEIFERKSDIVLHKVVHGAKRNREFLCYVCSARFPSKEELVQHKTTHKSETVSEGTSGDGSGSSTTEISEISASEISESSDTEVSENGGTVQSVNRTNHNSQATECTSNTTAQVIKNIICQCISCFEPFSKEIEITAHTATNRTGKCVFHCFPCNSFYTDNVSVLKHLKFHRNNICMGYEKTNKSLSEDYFSYCTTCDKKFKTESELLLHRNYRNACNFVCFYCPLQIKFIKPFINHLKSHTNFDCNKCKKSFNNLQVYRHHVRNNHNDSINADQQGNYSCELCYDEFASKIEFNKHMAFHKELSNDNSNEIPVIDVDEKSGSSNNVQVPQPALLPQFSYVFDKDQNMLIQTTTPNNQTFTAQTNPDLTLNYQPPIAGITTNADTLMFQDSNVLNTTSNQNQYFIINQPVLLSCPTNVAPQTIIMSNSGLVGNTQSMPLILSGTQVLQPTKENVKNVPNILSRKGKKPLPSTSVIPPLVMTKQSVPVLSSQNLSTTSAGSKKTPQTVEISELFETVQSKPTYIIGLPTTTSANSSVNSKTINQTSTATKTTSFVLTQPSTSNSLHPITKTTVCSDNSTPSTSQLLYKSDAMSSPKSYLNRKSKSFYQMVPNKPDMPSIPKLKPKPIILNHTINSSMKFKLNKILKTDPQSSIQTVPDKPDMLSEASTSKTPTNTDSVLSEPSSKLPNNTDSVLSEQYAQPSTSKLPMNTNSVISKPLSPDDKMKPKSDNFIQAVPNKPDMALSKPTNKSFYSEPCSSKSTKSVDSGEQTVPSIDLDGTIKTDQSMNVEIITIDEDSSDSVRVVDLPDSKEILSDSDNENELIIDLPSTSATPSTSKGKSFIKVKQLADLTSEDNLTTNNNLTSNDDLTSKDNFTTEDSSTSKLEPKNKTNSEEGKETTEKPKKWKFPIMCQCGIQLNRYRNWRKHELNKRTCTIENCTYKCCRALELKDHLKRKHSINYCQRCAFTSTKDSEYFQHLIDKHKCKTCNRHIQNTKTHSCPKKDAGK